MLRNTLSRLAPATPLRVLVLTMTPNGGAMTAALRILGYNPYIFENTYRTGNAMSHTKEWRAVLLRQKPFDPVILQARSKTTRADAAADEVAKGTERDYDALVGPPATLAYEAILQGCPRSTRVILVEEPDKLAWGSEYELLLRPIMQHAKSRARLVSMMADLHRMMDAMTEVRRTVSAQKKPNTSGSANKVGALQASALRLGAALDLFESQVKETVPKDRLLVYRVGEGWGPLCSFLGVPVPTASPSLLTAAASDGGSGGRPSGEPIPFPSHDPGATVFADLQDRLYGADRVVLVVFLMAAALALVVMSAFHAPVKKLVSRYHDRFNHFLMPYFDEFMEKGTPITLRGALQLSKKATMDLEAEVRGEGGVVSGVKDAVEALIHPHDRDAPNPAK